MSKRLLFQTIALAVLAPALLGGCVNAKTDYPSFALPSADESEGRVSMRFPSVSVPETSQNAEPEAMPAELDARLAAINAQASTAGQRFDKGLESARQSIAAASDAPTDTDRWARAQVQYADLASHHSAGRLALAELDLIAARAHLTAASDDDIQALAQLQTSLATELDEQARILAAFNADLEK
ncbi:MAG: hypothetical protein AAFZ11_07980 [Pseudomonadota bacterium]